MLPKPKINFVYSLPYNNLFNNGHSEIETAKEVNMFIEEIKSKWSEVGEEILRTIERVGFAWKIDKIQCFVVKNLPVQGISIPLTIKVFDNIDFAVYVLVHELVHINFFKEKRYLTILNLLRIKYKKNMYVIKHVVIYSAVRRVILTVFGEQFFRSVYELENKIKHEKANTDYRKELEIDAKKISEKIYPILKDENIITAFENYLKPFANTSVK